MQSNPKEKKEGKTRMIIGDWVKENPNEFVYIGSRTGWIYIGKASGFVEESLKLDKAYIDSMPLKIKTADRNIQFARDFLDSAYRNVTERRDFLIKKCTANLERAIKLKKHRLNQLNDYTPLVDRLIFKTYKHYTDVPGTCLIIYGDEIGERYFIDDHEGGGSYAEN